MRLNLLQLLLSLMNGKDAAFRSQVIEPILAESKEEKDPDVSYTLELIRDQLTAN